MPRPLLLATALLIAISMLPAAYLAKSRVTSSDQTRVQVVYDMDSQPKAKSQSTSQVFADGRSMRLPVPGTVAQGELFADSLFHHRLVDGEEDFFETRGDSGRVKVRSIRRSIDFSYLQRGQDRFEIYCAPCHGAAGRGDGLVSQHADKLAEGTWTPPSDLTSDAVAARDDGEIFDFITRGVRKMPSYAKHIVPEDRWAVVAYVRALQRSVRGTIEDVPESERAALGQE